MGSVFWYARPTFPLHESAVNHPAAPAIHPEHSATTGAGADDTPAAHTVERVAASSEYPQPAHPFADTDVDGDVAVDSDGHFIPNANALQLFDYFFIESGRLSDADIVAQIHAWLASRLQEPALGEARAFLNQYLNLRQLARQAFADGEMGATPRARLALIQQLREKAFGTELATQLFAREHAQQEARLQRMEAAATGEDIDPLLGLSAAEVRAQQRTEQVLAASAMASETSSPEELWSRRSTAYGYEAAYRLAELDRQRQQWAARVAAYSAQKQALYNDGSLSQSQRETQLQTLLQTSFNATERQRVQALEKIANE